MVYNVHVEFEGIGDYRDVGRSLLATIDRMRVVTPIKRLECLHDVSSAFWNYTILLADGRQWIQTLSSVGPNDTTEMTFAVADKWKMLEFILQREIRDELIRLITSYGLLNFRIIYSPA